MMNKIIKTKIIEKEDLVPLFLPLDEKSHKGDLGKLVICGGSKNYIGAPLLAEMSAFAMRSGCGLCTLAVPDFLLDSVRQRVITSSLFGLECNDENIIFDKNNWDFLLNKTNAITIGMGFSDGEADKIVDNILQNSNANIVLDADGLVQACKTIGNFQNRAILTPHIGEFSKITGLPIEFVKNNMQNCAVQFAKARNAVVVLKSHQTVITDGDKVFVNNTGNAKLSKGGSGDVLAGIIGSVLARNQNLIESAKAGCYILGRCAEISSINEYSHLATDTIDCIPKVLDEIQNTKITK